MRKAKAVAESPGATATWIQIGPGKFVRVESPGSVVDAPSASPQGNGGSDAPLVEAEAPLPLLVEETTVAAAIPADILELESDSETDQDTVVDAARDNGIAPDAFAVTTEDNGIAPDAFVAVPPAEIEPDDALPPDVDASPIAAAAFSRPTFREPLGILPRSWCGRLPRNGRATTRRMGRVAVSSGRFVRPGRRTRVSPPLRRPARRGAVRSRQSCRTFPPRSPPCLRLDVEPVKNTGMVLGTPLGQTEGMPGSSPCSFESPQKNAPAVEKQPRPGVNKSGTVEERRGEGHGSDRS
jgi:hypothetical protein